MADPKPAQAGTWTWGGLMRGDPYSQGAPGKPMSPMPTGQSAPLGSRVNPYTQKGQGAPGDWWQGSRPGQFGVPVAEQLPPEIGAYRQQMQRYENQPTPWQQEFNLMNPGFTERWQGVFNMPQRGEDPGAPFNFNLGSQLASAPLGEGAGPSSPWGGWQPAQEEDWSTYAT